MAHVQESGDLTEITPDSEIKSQDSKAERQDVPFWAIHNSLDIIERDIVNYLQGQASTDYLRTMEDTDAHYGSQRTQQELKPEKLDKRLNEILEHIVSKRMDSSGLEDAALESVENNIRQVITDFSGLTDFSGNFRDIVSPLRHANNVINLLDMKNGSVDMAHRKVFVIMSSSGISFQAIGQDLKETMKYFSDLANGEQDNEILSRALKSIGAIEGNLKETSDIIGFSIPLGHLIHDMTQKLGALLFEMNGENVSHEASKDQYMNARNTCKDIAVLSKLIGEIIPKDIKKEASIKEKVSIEHRVNRFKDSTLWNVRTPIESAISFISQIGRHTRGEPQVYEFQKLTTQDGGKSLRLRVSQELKEAGIEILSERALIEGKKPFIPAETKGWDLIITNIKEASTLVLSEDFSTETNKSQELLREAFIMAELLRSLDRNVTPGYDKSWGAVQKINKPYSQEAARFQNVVSYVKHSVTSLENLDETLERSIWGDDIKVDDTTKADRLRNLLENGGLQVSNLSEIDYVFSPNSIDYSSPLAKTLSFMRDIYGTRVKKIHSLMVGPKRAENVKELLDDPLRKKALLDAFKKASIFLDVIQYGISQETSQKVA